MRFAAAAVVILGVALTGFAQEEQESSPVELEVLRSYVGVWDAQIEVWSQGLDAAPVTFEGVETNRPYGEHWIASDFDSEFMGQTMKIHSIVGYDLDEKKLVGMIVDHGPYSASMSGEYDAESKTVKWTTLAKAPNGNPMVQNTTVTQKSPNERVLVLMVPSGGEGEFSKFMQITFTKRPESPSESSEETP